MTARAGNSVLCHRAIAALTLAVICILVPAALCQQHSYEHTFHASKSDVELALRNLHADTAGKLPLLEGFVAPMPDQPRYRHPYYQYSLQLTTLSATETSLRASANITAWYEDENASNSAYRSLPSNGRLENDLFDRIEETLQTMASAPAASATKATLADTRPETKSHPGAALPDSASAAKTAAMLRTPAPLSSPPAPSGLSAALPDNTGDKRAQKLQEQAKSLEEIARNQSRPDDLAVVPQARTPVFARPMQEAKVLLLADAEDEFQVLGAEADWVHVQLTGLQRGWMRRGQLDISGVNPRLLGARTTGARAGADLFQQPRQETATFPGDWEPLRGKKVRIIWVQLDERQQGSDLAQRASFARSVFRKTYPQLTHSTDRLEGVVIVFDAADGGMAAATLADLRRLETGELTDAAFWKRCWLDPPEAFKSSDR